jgi:type VI secretion system secreted protein Hcp
MAQPFYMTVAGEKQGDMHPGATDVDSLGRLSRESHKDEIQCQAFSLDIAAPTDPQSGQPTGRRVHRGLTVTKVFDKSSPLLHQALATSEAVTEAALNFYRTAPDGTEELYYVIKIKNAAIVSIKSVQPNALDPNNGPFLPMEEVTFAYKDIEWSHEVASTNGADSWEH